MPLFKFRVYWEDDNNIYRDIVLKSGQTFGEFQDAILQAFEFKVPFPATFYESNDNWTRGRAISSEVTVNKKGAAALSMVKTPVSALVDDPGKKFVYIFDPEKKWTFLIALIGLEKEEDPKRVYPFLAKSEGIAPPQSGIKGIAQERLLEIEERYDLNREAMEDQGFGEENEDGESSADSGQGDDDGEPDF